MNSLTLFVVGARRRRALRRPRLVPEQPAGREEPRRRAAQGGGAAAIRAARGREPQATADRRGRDQILSEKTKADSDLRSRKGQVAKRERDLKQLQDGLAEIEAENQRQREAVRRDGDRLSPRAKPRWRANGRFSNSLVHEENARLEHASGLTRDEARRQLLANLKAEARFEAAGLVKEIKDEAQRGAEAEATKIVALAMERIASDLSAERTVTRFALPPGGQMRGRIIGHEGKNIKAFEQVTGIQILLDESGESLQLSGFNPVKREIARRVLEMLLKDGNIHPRRIEELTRRHQRRLDDEMKKAGEQTLKELGIKDVQPEMVKLLGRSALPNLLRPERPDALQGGRLPHGDHGRRARPQREDRAPRRVVPRHRQGGRLRARGDAPRDRRRGGDPMRRALGSRSTRSPRTTRTSRSRRRSRSWSRPPTRCRARARARGARAPPSTSGASSSSRGSPTGWKASSSPTRSRRGARFASSRTPSSSTTRSIDLLASDLARRIETEMDYPGEIKVTVIREIRAQEVAR